MKSEPSVTCILSHCGLYVRCAYETPKMAKISFLRKLGIFMAFMIDMVNVMTVYIIIIEFSELCAIIGF